MQKGQKNLAISDLEEAIKINSDFQWAKDVLEQAKAMADVNFDSGSVEDDFDEFESDEDEFDVDEAEEQEKPKPKPKPKPKSKPKPKPKPPPLPDVKAAPKGPPPLPEAVCPSCKKSVVTGAKFCPHCGASTQAAPKGPPPLPPQSSTN